MLPQGGAHDSLMNMRLRLRQKREVGPQGHRDGSHRGNASQ